MDASACSKVDANNDDACAYFINVDNTEFSTAYKQKCSAIKYTKLPDYDFDSRDPWPRSSYTLQPRLRRIITLENPNSNTTRSLKLESTHHNATRTNISNRKIITITEDDDYDFHPKFSKESKKSTSNRATETEAKKDALKPHRNTTRLTSTRAAKDTRCVPKVNNVSDNSETANRLSNRGDRKEQKSNKATVDIPKTQSVAEKEMKRVRSTSLPKSSLSKNLAKPNESEQDVSSMKSKLYGNRKPKKSEEKARKINKPSPVLKSSGFEVPKKRQYTPVIHVPIEEICHKNVACEESPTHIICAKSDASVDTAIIIHKNVETSTEPVPKADQITDMEGYKHHITYKCIETDLIREAFDKLEVPNVSLTNDRMNEHLFDLQSKSLPNLQVPSIKIADNRKETSVVDTHYSKSTSYIISRATLTYKSQQEINFHVVDSNEKPYSNQSSLIAYPMNVVSVYNEEMRSKGCKRAVSVNRSQDSKQYKNRVNEIKSISCSYAANKELLKPSDVINSISINNGLMQSVLVCEQFQRELNFIDSFFESLQFLESSSLSARHSQVDNLERLLSNSPILDTDFDLKNNDYDNFLSKLENDADDNETMASKNLLLLNILIRDEQRRAKNLLCVLKRREDALKDFTKSQILYLENKKRQDNTDISALKKKQRGALLKLQHECGEMQRMRKALLALSEKRKLALMKTKKDLELKLKNDVNVQQIILGKKKPKRSSAPDRVTVPIKCFDLSSSGCEESNTSINKYGSDAATAEDVNNVAVVEAAELSSAEKGIQTGDSILGSIPEISPPIALAQSTPDENLVVVDGGYLNILFHNLRLPQIFGAGKQYEVNREALKNIVDSTNRPGDDWNDVVERLVSQTKDEEKSSTPSTARSLVEEFEQYYKSLGEDDRAVMCRVSEVSEAIDSGACKESEYSDESHCVEAMAHESCEALGEETSELSGQAGPLPVPVGAPYSADSTFYDTTICTAHDDSCTDTVETNPPCESSSPLTLEPTHAEAEELRRQQLAIEKEIKELEQQSRLLVVREIPDKPPPPYKPPCERPRPRAFRLDSLAEATVRDCVYNAQHSVDLTDAFQVLVQDFCEEAIEKHNSQLSDRPWDASNLLPHKPCLDPEKLISNTVKELNDALTPAAPSTVSGMSSRRTDHIDDILFAEWRRVEPEWTSLHNDEVLVKNQLFETIFQRILSETVDEYKRSILSPPPQDDSVVL